MGEEDDLKAARIYDNARRQLTRKGVSAPDYSEEDLDRVMGDYPYVPADVHRVMAMLCTTSRAEGRRESEARLREVEEQRDNLKRTCHTLTLEAVARQEAQQAAEALLHQTQENIKAHQAQVREASEALVGYGWPADLIVGISAVDFCHGAEKHRADTLEAQVRELRAALLVRTEPKATE